METALTSLRMGISTLASTGTETPMDSASTNGGMGIHTLVSSRMDSRMGKANGKRELKKVKK